MILNSKTTSTFPLNTHHTQREKKQRKDNLIFRPARKKNRAGQRILSPKKKNQCVIFSSFFSLLTGPNTPPCGTPGLKTQTVDVSNTFLSRDKLREGDMERAKEGGRERAWHLEIAATRYHGNQTKLMIRPMYDIVPSLCILVVGTPELADFY